MARCRSVEEPYPFVRSRAEVWHVRRIVMWK